MFVYSKSGRIEFYSVTKYCLHEQIIVKFVKTISAIKKTVVLLLLFT